LAASHDDANFCRVDLTVPVHLFLDASAQLCIGWGNLAHSRALIGRVHAPLVCKPYARVAHPRVAGESTDSDSCRLIIDRLMIEIMCDDVPAGMLVA
jgi:hypothetical protein